MAELFFRRVAQLHVTKILTAQTDFSGVDAQSFRIQNGSRLVFYLDVTAITGTLNLTVTNAAEATQTFNTIVNESYIAPGQYTIPRMDIQKFFFATITVSGGVASYSLGVTLADNSSSTLVEDLLQDILDELSGAPSTGEEISQYQEVSSVAAATETLVVSYTVPVAKTFSLHRVEVSGNNVAIFKVKVNATTESIGRIYWCDFNKAFEFNNSTNRGLQFASGDTIDVTVYHNRPYVGDFNARIQGRLED